MSAAEEEDVLMAEIASLRDVLAHIASLAGEKGSKATMGMLAAYALRYRSDTSETELDRCARILRSSVPERFRNVTSAVGAVQSYIAALEIEIEKRGGDPARVGESDEECPS